MTRIAAASVLVMLLLGSAAPALTQGGTTLITNAIVVDGSGAPARRGSVRIAGGRILEVGALAPRDGEAVQDAIGLTLAPGFIDTHSHHDRGLTDRREALGAISQGITTIVVGQDGGSAHPLADFFKRLETARTAVNVAAYAGHGTIRSRVMGEDFRRPARADEVARMADLLRQEMTSGALGLSSGLEYDPGIYSDPSEVVALAKVAATMGGRYASHIRSEDRDFWKAVDEAIAVGREARLPVQISHVKLAMRSLWGQSGQLLERLNAARAAGIELTADVYPYTYWQSGMTVLFPARDFTNRAAAEFALREVTSPEGLLVTRYPPNSSYEKQTLAAIAKLRGTDAPQAMMDMIAEAKGDISIVATSMTEADVLALTRWPFANICSDGTSTGGHPRGFGAFPRVLGRYVRENRAFSLEEAIRKMTSLAAANLGLKNRGAIKAGDAADLVLFDPEQVYDTATTERPTAQAVGIHTVWVNGIIVYRDGKAAGPLPGVVLRRVP